MKMSSVLVQTAAIAHLVCGLLASATSASPVGYAVQGFGDDQLYRVDLATGISNAIGPVNIDNNVLGLAIQPSSGTLFGFTDNANIITINTSTGAGSLVGPTGLTGIVFGGGLSFDSLGNLFLANEADENLYTVNPGTGVATLIGNIGQSVAGIAFDGSDSLYGISDTPDDNLVTINTSTSATSTVGALGVQSQSYVGADFAPDGTLWMVGSNGNTYTINTSTGMATLVGTMSPDFTSLAIPIPEPSTGLMAWIVVFGAGAYRRR